MAQSQELTSLWWPEDRIKATLDIKYIISRLQPENVARLFDLPGYGEGLTSKTYKEWILLKAGRLFLTLDSIGIPDHIFALVDESCDDDDMPFAEHCIDQLRLSPHGNDPALDAKFFRAQWRFLVRGIGAGEHVTYTENEGVPIELVRTMTNNSVQSRDSSVDRVILAGHVCRVYLRSQVKAGGPPHFFTPAEVLSEIKSLRKLAHEHIVSVFASYFADDSMCVLLTGGETDRTLHSFLTDEPIAFKRLAKEQRRETLIVWPHCLMSALSWLHAHGHAHGSIRPSNVLVDPNFNIFLGQFQAQDSLMVPPKVNDLEAYQYAAPERWVPGAVPIQATVMPRAESQVSLPSGGRTGRRKKPPPLAGISENQRLSPDSTSSRGTVIRIGQNNGQIDSPTRFSFAYAYSSSSSNGSVVDKATSSLKHSFLSSFHRKSKIPTAPSLTSSSSASTADSIFSPVLTSSASTAGSNTSIFSPHPPPSRGSILSTSTSCPSLNINKPSPIQLPADMFSLAAVILEILTHLCKRSLSSFTSHRAARNKMAGRGGGMADASYHLARNTIQVQSWIALLEGDALKRCRRNRGSDRVFHAVPRMLLMIRAMLSAEPEKRPSARRVQKYFLSAFKDIPTSNRDGSAVKSHCPPPENEKEKLKSKTEKRKELKESSSNPNLSLNLNLNSSMQNIVKIYEEPALPAPLPKTQKQTEDIDPCESSSVSDFDFGLSESPSDDDSLGELEGTHTHTPAITKLEMLDSLLPPGFRPPAVYAPVTPRVEPKIILPSGGRTGRRKKAVQVKA
ncbi:hypothetical protein N7495_008630 [Penicillium taxi]|uniref:uncharacterized protein n=1 Tax=Penicillium taxi TaxID=168475 RepID=UPI002544FD9C|nr:uncharacterized protein N7495_008630 [Penicillium taxi]KAJ5888589.1 hypothetical protein N7495_008630 [Penicillium taxi]